MKENFSEDLIAFCSLCRKDLRDSVIFCWNRLDILYQFLYENRFFIEWKKYHNYDCLIKNIELTNLLKYNLDWDEITIRILSQYEGKETFLDEYLDSIVWERVYSYYSNSEEMLKNEDLVDYMFRCEIANSTGSAYRSWVEPKYFRISNSLERVLKKYESKLKKDLLQLLHGREGY